MLRDLIASFRLRFMDTEALETALNLLNNVDYTKAGVSIKEIARAIRAITRELVRRRTIDFYIAKIQNNG